MIASVMATDSLPFDDAHRLKVFLFTGVVGQSSVAAGHLNAAVSQKLLEALKSHSGIEQLAGKGMSQTVQRISIML